MNHQLILKQRKDLTVEGVEDVFSFDESEVYLKTCDGNLTVEGENLHISKLMLEEGIVLLEGTVNSLYYSFEQQKKHGLFGRKTNGVCS